MHPWEQAEEEPRAGMGVLFEAASKVRRLSPPPRFISGAAFSCCGSCGSRQAGDYCKTQKCPREAAEELGRPYWASNEHTTPRRRWWQRGRST
jgi:hypothetical protein